MSTGEANSHRLLGPDISVLNDRGVKIEPDDDTAWIYPGCIREPDGSGGIERREDALAQQKRMSHACSIVVFPYDVTLGVTPSSKCRRSARKVNRGECPMVEQVAVTDSSIIRVSADDCAGRVNSMYAALSSLCRTARSPLRNPHRTSLPRNWRASSARCLRHSVREAQRQ